MSREEAKWNSYNREPQCQAYPPRRVGNGLWFDLVEGIDEFLGSSLLLNFL